MKAAQEAKANKILDTIVGYSTGAMSRRNWLVMMKSKNAIVAVATKPRCKYNRSKFNAFTNRELQDEYYAKTQELIVAYRISHQGDDLFWEITKTEFDYYNSL